MSSPEARIMVDGFPKVYLNFIYPEQGFAEACALLQHHPSSQFTPHTSEGRTVKPQSFALGLYLTHDLDDWKLSVLPKVTWILVTWGGRGGPDFTFPYQRFFATSCSYFPATATNIYSSTCVSSLVSCQINQRLTKCFSVPPKKNLVFQAAYFKSKNTRLQ